MIPFDACPGCGTPVGPPGPIYSGMGSVVPEFVAFECSRCGRQGTRTPHVAA